MFGKIFKYVLVILLGMILGIGVSVGAVYFIVTKTKVKTVTEKVPALNQYIGESLGDYTVLEMINVLGASDTTIGRYTEYFPFLDDMLTGLVDSEELTKYVRVDTEKLKKMTLSELGSGIGSAISVTASFSSLSSSLNFQLPDMPVFRSKEAYVKITDENNVVQNAYYTDKVSEIYYDSAADGGAQTADPVYVRAYDDGGTLLPEAEGKALYYRSEGIMELPVTDAITVLSETFGNTAELTVEDLDKSFGIDILGESDGLVKELVKPEDKIGELSAKLEGRVDALTLGKVIDVTEESSSILKRLENVEIGELDGEIKILTVGEIVGIDENSEPILRALQNATISSLNDTVAALKVSDVMSAEEIESNKILKWLSQNDTKINAIGSKINVMPFDVIVEKGANPITDALIDKGANIENIGEVINELTVSEIYDTEAFVKIGTGAGETAYNAELRCFELIGGEYRETEYAEGKELYQVNKSAGIWLITMYDKTFDGGVYSYRRVSEEPALTNLADYLIGRLTDGTAGFGACTLQELYEVGFINAPVSESVKDMTLNQVIDYVGQGM